MEPELWPFLSILSVGSIKFLPVLDFGQATVSDKSIWDTWFHNFLMLAGLFLIGPQSTIPVLFWLSWPSDLVK